MKRIGPKMRRVAHLVYVHGRITLIDVARQVGPHGSLRYGYETIERAIRAGLVKTAPPMEERRGLSLVLP